MARYNSSLQFTADSLKLLRANCSGTCECWNTRRRLTKPNLLARSDMAGIGVTACARATVVRTAPFHQTVQSAHTGAPPPVSARPSASA